MSMDSKRFKAYFLNDSKEFDSLRDCIKYAADFCERMMNDDNNKILCHVSIFDNTSDSLIGFVYVRRHNWIRIDVNCNYLDL